MSTQSIDFTTDPASNSTQEKPETTLAALADELSGMRFAILLTARWEASSAVEAERRFELRAELDHLRDLYFEKLDEIAMGFGVEAAVKTKDEVERTVSLPNEMKPPTEPGDAGEFSL